MASSYVPFQVHCSFGKPSVSPNFDLFKTTDLSSSFKSLVRELQQLAFRVDVPKAVKNVSIKLLDAFVDSVFEFVDHPLHPSQVYHRPYIIKYFMNSAFE
ncbi:Uncharacterized protein TCM_037187 [Theobroma cacao]|uniref:Uncharacterized protein n=1 Tax=Theobroma cacao TaxID=3641 RepID=A0A061GIQ8_THECC|nr:Uncharacterized protein TCM_037187 [Theobroma cacao]